MLSIEYLALAGGEEIQTGNPGRSLFAERALWWGVSGRLPVLWGFQTHQLSAGEERVKQHLLLLRRG